MNPTQPNFTTPPALQPPTAQPATPIKQTQVELAAGVNIFSRTPGLLEWTADNRIRLYTSQAGLWVLMFDITPYDIEFASYLNGALSL